MASEEPAHRLGLNEDTTFGTDKSMKVQYRITEDDYVNLARFHVWRNFIARPSTVKVVAGAIAVAVLVIIAWTLPESAPLLAFFAACGAIGGALGLFIRLFIRLFIHAPIRARRHYRQYKSIQEPFTAELTDGGIQFSNPMARETCHGRSSSSGGRMINSSLSTACRSFIIPCPNRSRGRDSTFSC